MLVLPGSASARDARGGDAAFPVFDVGGDDHDLGQAERRLLRPLRPEHRSRSRPMITIQTPGRDTASRSSIVPSFVLRRRRGGHEPRLLQGRVRGRRPRAAFEADPATAGCADGTHAADVVDRAEQHPRRAERARRRRPQGPRLPVHGLPRARSRSCTLTAERDLLRQPATCSATRRSPGSTASARWSFPPPRRDAGPDHPLRASRHPAAARGPRTRRPSTTRRRRR